MTHASYRWRLDWAGNGLTRRLFLASAIAPALSAQKPEVKKFVEFYLSQSKPLIEEVKYIPLPDQAYALARKHFADGKLGTGFGGVPEVGLKVEDLLAREAKL